MSSPLSDLEKLKCWMEEYVLDRRLGEDEDERFEGGEVHDFSKEPAPEDHQIRLWPAVAVLQQPFYGLIHRIGYDQWLVFPFSPYEFPATPEELKVRDAPPVRVVQGWNCRRANTRMVSASWQIAQLPDEKSFLFERWWLAVQSETFDPESYGGDCGPDIRHPLDPRLEYMDSERTRVDMTLGECPAEYAGESLEQAAEPSEEESYGEDADNPPS